MSAVTNFFLTPARSGRGAWAVVEWWESRRLVYNVAVGVAGAASLVVVDVLAALAPNGSGGLIPWQPVLAYAVLANAAYSSGPALDLLVRRRWGDAYAAVGPALFRYGFAFSVGLSLLPIPIAVLQWMARLLGVFS